MENLLKKLETIETKADFICFIELLINDLKSTEWANNSLESYLQAMANWTEDMEGYYHNNNLPVSQKIDWKVFANILISAKMYE